MRRVGLVGAVCAALMLTGCGAAPAFPAPSRTSAPCDHAASAPFDCHLFIATRATVRGAAVDWLATEPITAFFIQENGRLTAILDEPVNTWNIPVEAAFGRFWAANQAAVSAVGCAVGGRCEAGGFLGDLAGVETTYRSTGDRLVIEGGGRSLELRATGLRAGPETVCGTKPNGDIECRHLVSTAGSEGGRLVDAFRTDPVVAVRHGQDLEVRYRGATARLKLTADGTSASPARWSPRPASGGAEAAVLRRVLATVAEHIGALLLVRGDDTVLLEPGP